MVVRVVIVRNYIISINVVAVIIILENTIQCRIIQ